MFLNVDDKEERDRLPPFKTVTSYDERAGLRYEEYFEQFVLYPYLWKMKSHLMITLIKKQREHIRGKKSSVQTRSFTKSSSNSNLSFVDLRTIQGHTFNTFHEAACDLGLLDIQNKGCLALREAIESLHDPSQLRFLFSQIVLEGYLIAWILKRTAFAPFNQTSP
ncbi:hypothetical protein BDR03DRAFT_1092454 [Suillus americanus]|nr:hypothetical protein BDR03DRAFT_1092454 [Suillus americanus]